MSQTSQVEMHQREEKKPGNQVKLIFLQPWRRGTENDWMALQLAQGNGKDGQGAEKMQKLEEITRTANTD